MASNIGTVDPPACHPQINAPLHKPMQNPPMSCNPPAFSLSDDCDLPISEMAGLTLGTPTFSINPSNAAGTSLREFNSNFIKSSTPNNQIVAHPQPIVSSPLICRGASPILSMLATTAANSQLSSQHSSHLDRNPSAFSFQSSSVASPSSFQNDSMIPSQGNAQLSTNNRSIHMGRPFAANTQSFSSSSRVGAGAAGVVRTDASMISNELSSNTFIIPSTSQYQQHQHHHRRHHRHHQPEQEQQEEKPQQQQQQQPPQKQQPYHLLHHQQSAGYFQGLTTSTGPPLGFGGFDRQSSVPLSPHGDPAALRDIFHSSNDISHNHDGDYDDDEDGLMFLPAKRTPL